VKLLGLAGRLALIGAAVVTAVGMSKAPASARVVVSADKPRAGATDVTLSFLAEAKSSVAGIAFLRVVLPAGISSNDVTLVSAPQGWNLSATADGYNVGGPALDVGEDARYQVNVERLPLNATRLPFQTLQTYSDGRSEPDNPVPVLVLAPPRRPVTRPPDQQSPAPVQPREPVRPPPIPSSEPADVPTVTPSTEPTFSPPTGSPSGPDTSGPVPTSSAAALVTQSHGSRIWLWISAVGVMVVVASAGFLAWSWRRTPATGAGRRRRS